MKLLQKLTTTLITTTLFPLTLAASFASSAQAVNFGKVEVNQGSFVAIASPFGVGQRKYSLVVIEQLSNQQACWSELGSNPTVVNPLYQTFDFTGICGRSVDSNGYSVRFQDQDLGSRLILSIVPQGNELVLVASSLRERNLRLEIGRTHGYAEGHLKIHLDPGWRFTKRTYEGSTLGHVYFTSDGANAEVPPPPSTPNPNNNTMPPADRELIFTPSSNNPTPRKPARSIRPLPPPSNSVDPRNNTPSNVPQLPPPPEIRRIQANSNTNSSSEWN